MWRWHCHLRSDSELSDPHGQPVYLTWADRVCLALNLKHLALDNCGQPPKQLGPAMSHDSVFFFAFPGMGMGWYGLLKTLWRHVVLLAHTFPRYTLLEACAGAATATMCMPLGCSLTKTTQAQAHKQSAQIRSNNTAATYLRTCMWHKNTIAILT